MTPMRPCARLRDAPTTRGIVYLLAVGRALWIALGVLVMVAVGLAWWATRDDPAAGCRPDPVVVDATGC